MGSEKDFYYAQRCIWHAFDALDDNKAGTVAKGKLKVLTHNLAQATEITNFSVDNLLTDHDEPALNFRTYIDFLSKSLFNNIEDPEACKEAICSVSWMLCGTKFKFDKTILSAESAYKLWKVFITLADSSDGKSSISIPVSVDFDEVSLLLESFVKYVGRKWQPAEILDYQEVSPFSSDGGKLCTFQLFLEIFCDTYMKDADVKEITECTDEVAGDMLDDIIRKGVLLRKTEGKIEQWKERWAVLTSDYLRIYTNKDRKEIKGEFMISSTQSVAEKKSNLADPKTAHKHYKFTLTLVNKTVEHGALDIPSRNAWVAAIDEVKEMYRSGSRNYYKTKFEKRVEERSLRRRKAREEVDEKLKMQMKISDHEEEIKKLKQDLTDLEKSWQAKFDEEQAKLKELTTQKEEIENKLAEEQQARRDEEVVRNVQARLLEEETAAKKALEEAKAQLEEKLETEKTTRLNTEKVLDSTKEELDETIDELKKEQDKRSQTQKVLQNEKDKFSQFKLENEEKLAAENSAKLKLQQQYEATIEKLKATEQVLNMEKKNREDVEKMLSNEQKKLTQLDQTYQGEKSKREQLEKDLDGERKRANQLDQSFHSERTQKVKLEQEFDSEKRRCAQIIQDYQAEQKKVSQLEQSFHNERTKREGLENQFETIKTKLNQTETSLKAELTKREQCEKDLENECQKLKLANQSLAEEKKQCEQLEQSLNSEKKKSTQLEETQNNEVRRREQLEREIESERKNLSQANRAYQSEREKREKAEADIKKHIESQQSDIGNFKLENEKLKQQFEAEERKRQDLEWKLQAAQKEGGAGGDGENPGLQDELMKERERLVQVVTQKEEQIRTEQAQRQQMENNLKSEKEKVEKLEKEAAENDERFQELIVKLNRSEMARADMEGHMKPPEMVQSHRGPGAFHGSEFKRRTSSTAKETDPNRKLSTN